MNLSSIFRDLTKQWIEARRLVPGETLVSGNLLMEDFKLWLKANGHVIPAGTTRLGRELGKYFFRIQHPQSREQSYYINLEVFEEISNGRNCSPTTEVAI
jgi:hypothetical protein